MTTLVLSLPTVLRGETLLVMDPRSHFATRSLVPQRGPTIAVRPAAPSDVPALADLNRAAYPDLVQKGVVWNEDQLHNHLHVFPDGQRVAELDGRLVGAISTLVVPRTRDALAPHTWLDITDGGCFHSHDPGGETLYLADIYVGPNAWGRGVGGALYAALRLLCVSRGHRRIVAGGRLWSYFEYKGLLSPEEYVQRVIRGEVHDRVLRSQLRAGYAVRAILAEYLDDPRSGNFATLLEWRNPSVT
jgi:GNAT superfamily N-acetyltransferase